MTENPVGTKKQREELRPLHDCARDQCATARCPEYLAFDFALDGLDIAEVGMRAIEVRQCLWAQARNSSFPSGIWARWMEAAVIMQAEALRRWQGWK